MQLHTTLVLNGFGGKAISSRKIKSHIVLKILPSFVSPLLVVRLDILIKRDFEKIAELFIIAVF